MEHGAMFLSLNRFCLEEKNLVFVAITKAAGDLENQRKWNVEKLSFLLLSDETDGTDKPKPNSNYINNSEL